MSIKKLPINEQASLELKRWKFNRDGTVSGAEQKHGKPVHTEVIACVDLAMHLARDTANVVYLLPGLPKKLPGSMLARLLQSLDAAQAFHAAQSQESAALQPEHMLQATASKSPNTTGEARILGEMKCPRCGWVHVALTRAYAEKTSDDWRLLRKCFHCKGPAIGFTPSGPDDAPAGCTLQPIVLDDGPLDEGDHLPYLNEESRNADREKIRQARGNA
jgi:hypothetical protein